MTRTTMERRADLALRDALDAMEEARAPLCRRCHASFRAPGLTVCESCRHEEAEELDAIRATARWA